MNAKAIPYNAAAFGRARARAALYNLGAGHICYMQFYRELQLGLNRALDFRTVYLEELAIERLMR